METNMAGSLVAKGKHVLMVGREESYLDMGLDSQAWNPWTP